MKIKKHTKLIEHDKYLKQRPRGQALWMIEQLRDNYLPFVKQFSMRDTLDSVAAKAQIYMCIHVYMCICVYVCVYIHTHIERDI